MGIDYIAQVFRSFCFGLLKINLIKKHSAGGLMVGERIAAAAAGEGPEKQKANGQRF